MSTTIQQEVPARRMIVGLQVGWWVTPLMIALFWTGCARLAPHPDAIPSELEVRADSLKVAVRDAQRTAAELRTELDEQRKELADAQVARAQLQGMLQETERRLAEARQVIELQREELASARVERDRVAQTVRPLPSRPMKSSLGEPSEGTNSPPGSDGIVPTSVGMHSAALMQSSSSEEDSVPHSPPIATDAGSASSEAKSAPVSMPYPGGMVPVRTIVIQNGDTLWRLSRRHRVDLEALRLLNGLQNNLIKAGRTLRLPEPRLQHAAMQPASMNTLVQ